ncbi:hypothetical protein PV327_004056 [Microctonus hyperodae]|uniref:Uncharacterized protein n=1 Tax=Microctonus hyperodae TaxID=165561 RepID=A0AA39FBL8_MICHY|nr:hypothetical protein PV327_004056 [Microctonus hyperodae]
MSDDEEEVTGRSFIWKLTKAELEYELKRNNVAYDAECTVLDMKRILSKFMKRRQTEALSQTSTDEVPQPVDANVQIRNRNEDEIVSIATPYLMSRSASRPNSRPASRPASRQASPESRNTTSLLLESVRAELLKFREQVYDDIQAHLFRQETPEQAKPARVDKPEFDRGPMHARQYHRLDDELFVTSQAAKSRTSLFEKYEKIDIEKTNRSATMMKKTIELIEQTSTAHEEIQNFMDHYAYWTQQELPEKSLSSKISVTNEIMNCDGITKTAKSVEIQTDFIKMRNEITQQIRALHRFLSPACDNFNYWGNRKSRNECSENNSNYKLTSMQQLILLLLRLRMGYLIEDLAYTFDISTHFYTVNRGSNPV